MRRVLVVLLGLGLAATGAADRPRPPGAAAAPLPLISDHEFEPWEYSSGLVVCQHFDPEHHTRGMCDRPEDEHAPAGADEGATPA